MQGKITSYDSYHKRSKVRYDDDEEEWLALPRQRFICMLPRARSAGCTPQLLAAMQSLGAANVSWGANSLPCGMQVRPCPAWPPWLSCRWSMLPALWVLGAGVHSGAAFTLPVKIALGQSVLCTGCGVSAALCPMLGKSWPEHQPPWCV